MSSEADDMVAFGFEAELGAIDAFYADLQERMVGPSIKATKASRSPLEVAQIADRNVHHLEALATQFRVVRNTAIRDAVAEGRSRRTVASVVGMTPQAVAKIVSDLPGILGCVDSEFLSRFRSGADN